MLTPSDGGTGSGPAVLRREPVATLSDVLGRQLTALRALLRRMMELEQLLSARDARFLSEAAAEAATACRSVRELDLHRALAVLEYAERAGLRSAEPSLAAIADACGAPWRAILLELGAELRDAVTEIEQRADNIRRLGRHGAAGLAMLLSDARAEPLGARTDWEGNGL